MILKRRRPSSGRLRVWSIWSTLAFANFTITLNHLRRSSSSKSTSAASVFTNICETKGTKPFRWTRPNSSSSSWPSASSTCTPKLSINYRLFIETSNLKTSLSMTETTSKLSILDLRYKLFQAKSWKYAAALRVTCRLRFARRRSIVGLQGTSGRLEWSSSSCWLDNSLLRDQVRKTCSPR